MRPWHIALAVLVAAIWGFNFIVIRVGLDSFPPLLLNALRFLLAATPLLVIGRRPQVAWGWIIAIGMALGTFQFGLLFTSMTLGLAPGTASLIMQAQAFFTLGFAALALGERPRPRQLLGMLVAFSGIGLIAIESPAGSLLGLALGIVAAASWAAGNVMLKLSGARDMLQLVLWYSLVPPLPLLVLSWFVEGPDAMLAAMTGMTALSIGVLLYLSLISTMVAYGLWAWLMQTYTTSGIAPFSLLVPVFGMSLSAWLFGEALTPVKLVAAALIMLGLALTVWQKRAIAPAAPPS